MPACLEIDDKPIIKTQKTDGIDVGRITIPVVRPTLWRPNTAFLECLNTLNGIDQPNTTPSEVARRHVVFNLNHNNDCNHGPINHERSVSAYFTVDPTGQEIIIEWGTIDSTDESAKLHTYLNRKINYWQRIQQGMKLSSGHIARVSTKLEEIYLALIDNLPPANKKLLPEEPLGKLVNALHYSGFVPLGGDGFVRLPAF